MTVAALPGAVLVLLLDAPRPHGGARAHPRTLCCVKDMR